MKNRFEEIEIQEAPSGKEVGDAFCHMARYRDLSSTQSQRMAALAAIYRLGRVPGIQDEIDVFFNTAVRREDQAQEIILTKPEPDLQ